MTTIMTAERNGKTARCDDTCHHARQPVCRCICGGRYHGAGVHAQAQLDDDVKDGLWSGYIDAEGVLQLGPPSAMLYRPGQDSARGEFG